MSTIVSNLTQQGWTAAGTRVGPDSLAALCQANFTAGSAGTRCLLDEPSVAATARLLLRELVDQAVLPAAAVAIQAIAFDKSVDANWKVTWHQDVMFPFAHAVRAAGYRLAGRKGGIDYARPPREVLEDLLAVRLHLDNCDETNGPLRVAPGSHRAGILKSTEIARHVAKHGQTSCLARAGEVLLLKPLLLHASSPATAPRHRRVLHFVYYAGPPLPERWHREIG